MSKFNQKKMVIDDKLKSLRISVRRNSRAIINHIIQNNISRLNKNKNSVQDVCMFCSSTSNLTKEHVIPRWTFENSIEKYFTTNVNGLNQTYNRTTIPACSLCNNELLSSVEKYITKLFSEFNPNLKNFSEDELSNIIRWLEIVDFKFQILNARKVFTASKENGFVPYLADFQISVLRIETDFSPSKVMTEIRRSQKRMTIKSKSFNLNSLIVFKTANESFHFFHTMDKFIFIELPQYKLALFYFYKQTFPTVKDGYDEAMKTINQVYN